VGQLFIMKKHSYTSKALGSKLHILTNISTQTKLIYTRNPMFNLHMLITIPVNILTLAKALLELYLTQHFGTDGRTHAQTKTNLNAPAHLQRLGMKIKI
jgi:hypothetical protein